MLSESITIKVIETIGLNSLPHEEMYGEEDGDEEDTDMDESASEKMRRNLSSFLATEAQKGCRGCEQVLFRDPFTLHSPLIL